MSAFEDEVAAKVARDRIEALAQTELGESFFRLFEGCVDPDRSLLNLEAWMRAATSPASQIAHILSAPSLARAFVDLLGASQPLANALVQNPELAAVLTDPAALKLEPSREAIEREGRQLVAVASGYSYALDRLRFLRQKWMLPIVIQDIAGTLNQEQAWRALSELADALITLASEVAWREYAAAKGVSGPCPVSIVAFGKHGGHEVNYSSDLDLVYVAGGALDEAGERHATRFCEMFGRALSDKMGRGSLYRVDLRLRPFGGAGPVVHTRRAVEAYYRSHAQIWEVQALVRSRAVTGGKAMSEWWDALRAQFCFRERWSSAALEEIVAMRGRVEQSASQEDLKRGVGGIRDVEFLTQLVQLVHGHKSPEVRTPNTLSALSTIQRLGLLPMEEVSALTEGYSFLRKAEHRCQLADDQHTHALPTDSHGRLKLARLMGFAGWEAFLRELDRHRHEIRRIYEARVRPQATEDPRSVVAKGLGHLGGEALKWVDALPESESFYHSIAENRDSLERIRLLLTRAPALAGFFRESVALTEAAVSGEIEEPEEVGGAIKNLPIDATLEKLAATIRFEWVSLAARWALNPKGAMGPCLAKLGDAVLRHMASRIYADFDVVALGTYATGEMSLCSDYDLLWLVSEASVQPQAEQQGEQLLLMLDAVKRLGAPVKVDLRLRPEGRQGLLVRTYAGFKAYELGEMEMWERFALGQARSVSGDPMAEAVSLASAYALPLTPERLEELLALKKRMELERVSAKYRHRHVKLGHGGLSDIEWFVHLHELRYPTATQAGARRDLGERIRTLGHARLIHALEQEALLRARDHLLATRDRLVLMGFTTDIVPENPDKLDQLAAASGRKDGNAFLAEHEEVVQTVRSIYEEGVDRLRS